MIQLMMLIAFFSVTTLTMIIFVITNVVVNLFCGLRDLFNGLCSIDRRIHPSNDDLNNVAIIV